jgi:uncharacterized repeat protein (TIGR02543 family)
MLYAKWTPIQYAIAYVLGGGSNSAANPAAYTVESDTITLQAPAKPGYAFGGWYGDESYGGSAIGIIPKGSTGNRTLYAKWTLASYTITYVLGGGSNSAANPAAYAINSDTITLQAPARVAYAFDGWYEDQSFAGSAIAIIPQGSTGSRTLYAKWTPTPYAIAYVLNGGANSADNPAEYSIESGDIALQAPTRDGYTFGGWYSSHSHSGSPIASIPQGSTGNKTLYASWTPTPYAIAYVLYGGSNSAENPTAYTVESDTITLQAPARAGYAFGGWYSDQSYSGSAVTLIPQGSTGSRTLYAKWSLKPTFTVTFDANGGSSVEPQTVAEGDTAAQPANPDKPGYVFDGWYKDSATFADPWIFGADAIARDTTLYARWALKTFAVTFDASGGTLVARQLVPADSTAVRPDNPEKAGYLFGGWYRDSALSLPWNFPTDVVTDSLTLYARWIESSKTVYTVTFDSRGGSPIDPQVAEDGGTASQPAAPTRIGYDFAGWSSDTAPPAPAWDFAYDPITADTTLYALWTPVPLTLASVLVNGVEQTIANDAIHYIVPCGDDLQALNVSFTKSPEYAISSIPGDSLSVDVSRPFLVDTLITLTSPYTPEVQQYTLRLEKRFVFDSIVKIQFNGGLMMVVNNPESNGGFYFQQATWQHKVSGVWITIANGFTYAFEAEMLTDTLRVLLLETGKTTPLSTCPYIPDVNSTWTQALGMPLYPNPVVGGSVVHFKEDFLDKAHLREGYTSFCLMDIQGNPVATGDLSELYRGLTMPTLPGVYYLIVEGKTGRMLFKIAVGR